MICKSFSISIVLCPDVVDVDDDDDEATDELFNTTSNQSVFTPDIDKIKAYYKMKILQFRQLEQTIY